MPSVFQPWPSHRNMVSSTFSFRFYQQLHACKVFLFPRIKWGKQLQPVGVWIYDYLNRFAVFSRSLIACVLHRKSAWWQFYSFRFVKHYFLTFSVQQLVSHWVKSKISRYGQRSNDFWRRYKSMCVRVAVVSFSKVSVKGSNDAIFSIRVIGMSCPLANAWSTSVGQDYTAHFIKHIQQAVAFGSISYLLRTWCDSKFCFCCKFLIYSLLCHRSCSGDIFIG